MRLSLKEIEKRVAPLGNRKSYDREFIFGLLLAYGRSPGNVTRLRSNKSGSLNVARNPDQEVAQKGVVYFRELQKSTEEDLLRSIENLSSDPAVVRFSTRFVIVSDYEQLLARDIKTSETLIIDIRRIAEFFTFFLPWAGMEKSQYVAETHADVKAAERMAKLFDELTRINPDLASTMSGRHSLNTFFTRLLFCFFAEDTGIFSSGQFTTAVSELSRLDGGDLRELLEDIFKSLNTAGQEHRPNHLQDFPYVNGRLFEGPDDNGVPLFNKRSRDLLMESGNLKWSEINPDIFGSMFQAIVTPGQRSALGQHYTSVPNILKTIEPLFLDELKADYDVAFDDEKKLESLLRRIGKIKVFDPACGSGNFLVIAYKELRKLEHGILERLSDLRGRRYGLFDSVVGIESFYGIEIDDFAAEVAVLSLWIAKHQMNIEFEEKFGSRIPLIPLKETGSIRKGNANRIDWNSVCPNDGKSEIYLIGNPPYKGGKSQSAELKEDYLPVFGNRPYSKDLDYVALWFVKGADYIRGTQAQLAFVATNSVSQGEHVGLLFPMIFQMGLEIGYAYTSFKWENNAKRNAGVTVVVVSLRNTLRKPKFIFGDGIRLNASNINGYLSDAPNVFVYRRNKALSGQLPRMVLGSMPRDGGHLILSRKERDELQQSDPGAEKFVRRYVGADDFINGLDRYCLWIMNHELPLANQNPIIARRLAAVTEFRHLSKALSTAALAKSPIQFGQNAYKDTEAIIVPRVSSERRDYVPIGYLDRGTVISDSANAVYDAEPWIFGLLTSRIHMVWVKAVGGRLKNDLRYGTFIVYNNFPVPHLSTRDRASLSEKALRILDVREYFPEKSLGDLYDPNVMPDNLRLAHEELDRLVDGFYRLNGFKADEERLSHLFERYTKLTDAEVIL